MVFLTLSACAGMSSEGIMPTAVPQSFDCNVPFTTVLQEMLGGQKPQLRLITTQDEWCALWDEIHSITQTPPACDTARIDFQTQAALVAATNGPTTCTGIAITCVQRDSDDNLTVVYRLSGNSPTGVLCGQMFVDPVQVVSVSLPVGLATFVQDTSTP
jgi:hypothetical protein